jgi:hypothetical protein
MRCPGGPVPGGWRPPSAHCVAGEHSPSGPARSAALRPALCGPRCLTGRLVTPPVLLLGPQLASAVLLESP